MSKAYNAVIVAASTTMALALLSIAFLVTHSYPQKPTPTPQKPAVVKQVPNTKELFTDVNNERIKAALPALVDNPSLDASAAAKCQDEVQGDYFEHVSPSGVKPEQFALDKGVTYKEFGENLALDPQEKFSSQDTVNSWMKSPGHRANILKPQYTDVGYAVCFDQHLTGYGDTYIIVQHFIER